VTVVEVVAAMGGNGDDGETANKTTLF